MGVKIQEIPMNTHEARAGTLYIDDVGHLNFRETLGEKF